MSLRQRFAQLAPAAAISQAIPLLMAPLLTRQFGPEALGHWALFAALAANLATVANLRYEYAIVLPRRAGEAALLLELCLWVGGVVGLLSMALSLGLLLGAPLLSGRWAGLSALNPALLALGPVVALAGFQQAMTLWANRLGRFGLIGQARVLQQGGLAVAQGLAMLAGWTSAASLVAAQLLSSVLAPWWLQAGGLRLRWRRSRTLIAGRRHVRHLRRMAKAHRQFLLINSPHAFVNALQETLVLACITAWAGAAAAGYYAVMVRLVKAPASLIGGALSEVLLSTLAADWRGGQSLRPRLGRSLWALAGLALPGMVLLMIVGPGLFAWVLGEEWRVSGELARWFAPYVAAHFVAAPLMVAPMVTGRQAGALVFSLAGNALYIATLCLVLGLGGSLAAALGGVSLVLPFYFVALLAWIWRGGVPASNALQGARA
ncbi:lipopolysaccharide biosynthesis protein [Roseateles sp. DB2]|uniref:lipopolysaccharide biosynthesis protein n=1 Tax=Roseateles sp. DB2 TaxID=3453717 RepID=UPI003EEF5850